MKPPFSYGFPVVFLWLILMTMLSLRFVLAEARESALVTSTRVKMVQPTTLCPFRKAKFLEVIINQKAHVFCWGFNHQIDHREIFYLRALTLGSRYPCCGASWFGGDLSLSLASVSHQALGGTPILMALEGHQLDPYLGIALTFWRLWTAFKKLNLGSTCWYAGIDVHLPSPTSF